MSRRIIDLTLPIHNNMPAFPSHWHPTVEIKVLGRLEKEHRETRELVFGTHTGTHCDAPRHFIPGGSGVDEIPLELLIGPAVIVDFSAVSERTEMTVADFERELKGRRPKRLIMRFDWSDHWGNSDYYTDHPFISQASAQWLVDQGVKLLAMDTPMPDNPAHGAQHEPDSPNHKVLLGAGVILLEYLTNLRFVQSREIELVALPLNIARGDGSPVRCVAIEL